MAAEPANGNWEAGWEKKTPRQAKLEARGLRAIWEGLPGDLLIVMPVAPASEQLWQQRLNEIEEDQPDAVADAPSPTELARVLDWIQHHYARTLFEGDLAAERSVFYLLSQMYPISRIRFGYTPDYVEEGPEGPTLIPGKEEELARHTLILPCGPRANPLTRIVLSRLGREDLFRGFQLQHLNGRDRDQREYYDANERKDFGVALKTRNPFADDDEPQRCFVLAGCHAFGTQAAASAVTVAPLASEITQRLEGVEEGFEIRAAIRNSDDSRLTYGGTDTMVRIIEPFETSEHKNHYAVRVASELMRRARLDSRIARSQTVSALFACLTCLAGVLYVLQWVGVSLVDPVLNLFALLGSAGLWLSASEAVRFYLRRA